LRKQLILKNKEERRIIKGHPWVFSNEIRETKGEPGVGDIVELIASNGTSLGTGLYNPHSLISFRLLSDKIEEIDKSFFASRIASALSLRERLYPRATCYRLVHGEGDFLSGLIIDRFNDHFAVQTFAFGMEQRLPAITEVLCDMFSPTSIVARNESSLRLLENLPLERTVLYGEPGPTEIVEDGLHYIVDVMEGQKTGFFLDQRESRAGLKRLSKGSRVLDGFCNDGGFALTAARAGAQSVTGIDISSEAIARARDNARLNSLEDVQFEVGDMFDVLRRLRSEARQFDVLILDPPSFTKTKKHVTMAKKGYRELHCSAFPLIAEGGILLTASCSHHILPDVFLDIVHEAAKGCGRKLQLLDWRGAPADHPVLPAVPETRYLKVGL
jgi:23S rRNA (cytosine1962-C5)-methyltransferase